MIVPTDQQPLYAPPGGESHYATAPDGTRIHYWEYGAGTDVILIVDGLACGGFLWSHFVRYFSRHYRILLMQHRGHGRTENPNDLRNLTMEHLAADALAVADAAGAEQFLLTAYSMGVQVGFEVAHQVPQRIKGIIVVNGSYQYPIDTFHDTATLKRIFPLIYYLFTRYPKLLTPLWKKGASSVATYLIAWLFETKRDLVRQEDFRPYFEHVARVDVEVFARMLNYASHHTAEHYLPEIKKPVLIIAGGRDSFTPVWVSKLMNERLPDSDLLVVRGGSHVSYLEQPLLINLRIERFLLEKGFLEEPLESAVSSDEAN